MCACVRGPQDWDLEGVALLATLRCVSLRSCEGVTDEGVAQLAALPRLARLVRLLNWLSA